MVAYPHSSAYGRSNQWTSGRCTARFATVTAKRPWQRLGDRLAVSGAVPPGAGWPDRVPVLLGNLAEFPGQARWYSRSMGRVRQLPGPVHRARSEQPVLAVGTRDAALHLGSRRLQVRPRHGYGAAAER